MAPLELNHVHAVRDAAQLMYPATARRAASQLRVVALASRDISGQFSTDHRKKVNHLWSNWSTRGIAIVSHFHRAWLRYASFPSLSTPCSFYTTHFLIIDCNACFLLCIWPYFNLPSLFPKRSSLNELGDPGTHVLFALTEQKWLDTFFCATNSPGRHEEDELRILTDATI